MGMRTLENGLKKLPGLPEGSYSDLVLFLT